MRGRRDRAEVIVSILEAIQKEDNHAKPTHIMYKANLSYDLLKSYLSELKEKGIIVEDVEGNKTFITMTKDGFQLLSELRRMKRFMESFGL
ncbi:MAG: hypothetical protein J7L23_03900 [Candidatus Diapherotrites archaeon]|nr:hypothetical protein [Candidatus Diapherotrites archaeon]